MIRTLWKEGLHLSLRINVKPLFKVAMHLEVDIDLEAGSLFLRSCISVLGSSLSANKYRLEVAVSNLAKAFNTDLSLRLDMSDNSCVYLKLGMISATIRRFDCAPDAFKHVSKRMNSAPQFVAVFM